MPQNHRLVSIVSLAVLVLGAFAIFAAPVSAQIGFPNSYFAIPNPSRPGDCTRSSPCGLQEAVDLADPGDIVYLRGGSFKYTSTGNQVLYINKSVVIQGGWNGSALGRVVFTDPEAYPSVLDGENTRRVVLIENNASPSLIGLTVQKGYVASGNGGGILISNTGEGDVKIADSKIVLNSAKDYGGGIRIDGGAVTIRNCELIGNSVVHGGGAINAAMNSSVTIEGSVVASNSAQYGPFGDFDRAQLTARSNYIYENTGSPTIALAGEPDVLHVLENNVIFKNTGNTIAGTGSNGIMISILHNTLVDNQGYGILMPNLTTGTIANNIITGAKYESIYLGNGGVVVVSANLFWQNAKDPNLGTGWVIGDPKLDGTFHLTDHSPAINAGVTSVVEADFEGQLRALGLPDIGADEFMLPLYIPVVEK